MTMAKHCLKNSSGLRNPVPAWKNIKKHYRKCAGNSLLVFYSSNESNLKHRCRLLLQNSTLYPPPPPTVTQDNKKWAPTKGPNTLLFLLKMKNSSNILNMQEAGGKNLFQSAIHIYILLQNLLLQTGSFWQAEKTWQWILTNLHERQITMVGKKN